MSLSMKHCRALICCPAGEFTLEILYKKG